MAELAPSTDSATAAAASASQPVTFAEAFRFWLKLGFINFGGPAGQIAIMHRELVDQKRWVPESLFLRALNFSMLLPGPEATELAIYIAWRMHGITGGIVAGPFFVIPSIFVLLLLSWLSVAHTDVPVIRGLLYGVQPVVMAIVLDGVIRVGRRTWTHRLLYVFAIAPFVALFFLHVPFPSRLAWLRSRGWYCNAGYQRCFVLPATVQTMLRRRRRRWPRPELNSTAPSGTR